MKEVKEPRPEAAQQRDRLAAERDDISVAFCEEVVKPPFVCRSGRLLDDAFDAFLGEGRR